MKNIYVGNLDFGSTEEQVRALFEPYGAIEKVTLVRDRDTGQSRGFAFVQMVNDAEAQNAIAAINGSVINGRALNVNEARPKPDRGFGGSGGRPGFGGGGRGGRGGGRNRY
jgi:cold-inducible RNA-binding protein